MSTSTICLQFIVVALHLALASHFHSLLMIHGCLSSDPHAPHSGHHWVHRVLDCAQCIGDSVALRYLSLTAGSTYIERFGVFPSLQFSSIRSTQWIRPLICFSVPDSRGPLLQLRLPPHTPYLSYLGSLVQPSQLFTDTPIFKKRVVKSMASCVQSLMLHVSWPPNFEFWMLDMRPSSPVLWLPCIVSLTSTPGA